jgi:hypothetical protein
MAAQRRPGQGRCERFHCPRACQHSGSVIASPPLPGCTRRWSSGARGPSTLVAPGVLMVAHRVGEPTAGAFTSSSPSSVTMAPVAARSASCLHRPPARGNGRGDHRQPVTAVMIGMPVRRGEAAARWRTRSSVASVNVCAWSLPRSSSCLHCRLQPARVEHGTGTPRRCSGRDRGAQRVEGSR